MDDGKWKNELDKLFQEANSAIDDEIKRLKGEGKYNSGLDAYNPTVKEINERYKKKFVELIERYKKESTSQ